MSKNTAALKALGIKTNVTYSVVCVGCTQKDCVYHSDCQDNAIGLSPKEKGGFMICHDYKTDLFKKEEDKRVYWRRIKQSTEAAPARTRRNEKCQKPLKMQSN